MIFGDISDILNKNIFGDAIREPVGKALNLDVAMLESGKYDLGNDDFVLIQRYNTKPADEVLFESHRKYIDIQIVIKGSEKMYSSQIGDLIPNGEFNFENDIGFYKQNGPSMEVIVSQRQFAIFFPEDGHKSSCMVNSTESVIKMVVKINKNKIK